MKVAVIGYSGSGKSTLAKYISSYYHIPVLYLDTIHYEADWKERSHEKAISMIADFLKENDWVIDGNYSKLMQDERLELADYIVYLSFNRIQCLFRILKRYFKYRNTVRESVAKGCWEKLDAEFIWHILHKGRDKKKQQYYSRVTGRYHSKCIVLKNQRQLDQFMIHLFDDL